MFRVFLLLFFLLRVKCCSFICQECSAGERRRQRRRMRKGWKNTSSSGLGALCPPTTNWTPGLNPLPACISSFTTTAPCLSPVLPHLLTTIEQQQRPSSLTTSSSSLRHAGCLMGVGVFFSTGCDSFLWSFVTPTLLSSCESTLVWHKHCTGNTVCKVLSKIYYHYSIIMIIIIIIITHLQLYM